MVSVFVVSHAVVACFYISLEAGYGGGGYDRGGYGGGGGGGYDDRRGGGGGTSNQKLLGVPGYMLLSNHTISMRFYRCSLPT